MGDRIIRKVEVGAERLAKKVVDLHFINCKKNKLLETSALLLRVSGNTKYDFRRRKIISILNMKTFLTSDIIFQAAKSGKTSFGGKVENLGKLELQVNI